MTTIGSAATAITVALGIAKELITVNKMLGENELRLKIADLSASLASAQMALAAAEAEALVKDGEIAELKRALNAKPS
jgi:hypothetical protein